MKEHPGDRLQQMLDDMGWSVNTLSNRLQEEYPELSGTSYHAVSRFQQTGGGKDPAWTEAVADLLGVRYAWLMAGHGAARWEDEGPQATMLYEIGKAEAERTGKEEFHAILKEGFPEHGELSVAVKVLFGHALSRAVEWQGRRLSAAERAKVAVAIGHALRSGWAVRTGEPASRIPDEILRPSRRVQERTPEQRAFSDYALGLLVAIETALPHR